MSKDYIREFIITVTVLFSFEKEKVGMFPSRPATSLLPAFGG